jgi:hypothetical protein
MFICESGLIVREKSAREKIARPSQRGNQSFLSEIFVLGNLLFFECAAK